MEGKDEVPHLFFWDVFRVTVRIFLTEVGGGGEADGRNGDMLSNTIEYCKAKERHSQRGGNPTAFSAHVTWSNRSKPFKNLNNRNENET